MPLRIECIVQLLRSVAVQSYLKKMSCGCESEPAMDSREAGEEFHEEWNDRVSEDEMERPLRSRAY